VSKSGAIKENPFLRGGEPKRFAKTLRIPEGIVAHLPERISWYIRSSGGENSVSLFWEKAEGQSRISPNGRKREKRAKQKSLIQKRAQS